MPATGGGLRSRPPGRGDRQVRRPAADRGPACAWGARRDRAHGRGRPDRAGGGRAARVRDRAGAGHGLGRVRGRTGRTTHRGRRGRGLRGRSGCPGAHPSCARSRSRANRRPCWSWPTSAAICTAIPPAPTAGPASRRWRAERSRAAMSTWPSATTRRRSARCAGSPRMTYAARPRRSPRPTSDWRRSACCAGSSATSCPTGGWTYPTTYWPSWTGCRPAFMAVSGCPAPR